MLYCSADLYIPVTAKSIHMNLRGNCFWCRKLVDINWQMEQDVPIRTPMVRILARCAECGAILTRSKWLEFRSLVSEWTWQQPA